MLALASSFEKRLDVLDPLDEFIWLVADGILLGTFESSFEDRILVLNGVAAIAIAPVINVVVASRSIGLRSKRRMLLDGWLVLEGCCGDHAD